MPTRSARTPSLPFQRLILPGLLIAVAVLVSVQYLSIQTFQKFIRVGRQENHALRVLRNVEEVFSATQDVESSTRGFILTGQEEFLEHFSASLATQESGLRELRAAEEELSHHAGEFRELQALVKQKADLMSEGVRLRRGKGLAAGAAFMAAGFSRTTMESFVSATATQGSCAFAAGTLTCTVGNLANGASASATVTVTAGAAAVPSVSNTATVAGNETDPNAADNSATSTTTVNPAADLRSPSPIRPTRWSSATT